MNGVLASAQWVKGEFAVIGADTILDISVLLFLANVGLSDKFCLGKKKDLTRVLFSFMSLWGKVLLT